MRVRRSIIAAAAAVVLGSTGALLAPAAASAHSAAQTLTFTSVVRNFVSFTSTTGAEQDTDVTSAGTVIGFDEVSVTLGTTANTADIAFALNGGLLYGTLTISRSTGSATGPVTGGTGSFAGATGTIKAKAISGTKHAVTITYST